MYIITVRRITSGELLKYRKGFLTRGGYGTALPRSTSFSLTLPGLPLQAEATRLGSNPDFG